jgi:para-nitrobenzyl esterase
MIFGESGGGGKVATLLTMPATRGLFKRAAIQSGIKSNNDRGRPTVFGKHRITVEQAAHFRDQVFGKLGLGRDDYTKLLDLPAADIANAQGEVEAENLVLGPVIDGTNMPRHPFDPDVTPTARDIPLIIGANGDEWFNYIAAKPQFKDIDWDGVVQWSVDWHLDRATAERITAEYRALMPDASPEDVLTAICSDHMIRVPSVRIADLRAAGAEAPVWHYSFTYDSPVSGRSVHALEIPFVFDNVDATPLTGEGPERHALAARMADAWIAFARTGNPNHEGLPEWPVYDAGKRTMVFDLETRVEVDPFSEQTKIWDGVL